MNKSPKDYYNEKYLDNFDLSENSREYYESGKFSYIEYYMPTMDVFDAEKGVFPDGYSFGEEAVKQLKGYINDLTPRQRKIVNGLLAGKTQTQIAKELGCVQSAISLELSGRYDYKRKKYYGGIYKRLADMFGKKRQVVRPKDQLAE